MIYYTIESNSNFEENRVWLQTRVVDTTEHLGRIKDIR